MMRFYKNPFIQNEDIQIDYSNSNYNNSKRDVTFKQSIYSKFQRHHIGQPLPSADRPLRQHEGFSKKEES
jgi:hypothetical protein